MPGKIRREDRRGVAFNGGSREPAANHTPTLTQREREIIAALLDGCPNKQIADRLGVSDQTVKNQLATLFKKLRVASRVELVLYAVKHRLGR